MNYLGHLILSGEDQELQLANLYGDFFKGSRYELLPKKVMRGIKLHRGIDHFVDHHPISKQLLKQLYPVLPKIAPIALDLFFDHLLAKHWEKFHHQSLTQFSEEFFSFALDPNNHHFSDPEFHYSSRFMELLEIMHRGDWLNNYQLEEGLTFACTGLSQRISFENNLHEGPAVFARHHMLLTEGFFAFMEDAFQHFGIQHSI
jgi:acyl carrier protein phosphodiesterase